MSRVSHFAHVFTSELRSWVILTYMMELRLASQVFNYKVLENRHNE
jgi:hypothetical protein